MHIKWKILITISSGISVIFLDQSILPVALPAISKELNISELGLQWLINAYLLTLTAFVLAGGRIGDMFGHRKVFSLGMLIFMLSSITCGFSQSTEWFIASRALQGIGGAMIIPTGSPLFIAAFPEKERGKALGVFSGIGAVFLSLGPLMGGFITQFLNWRYIFWINIPIVTTGLLFTFLTIPKSKKRENESFDFLGFICTSIGIISIIIGPAIPARKNETD